MGGGSVHKSQLRTWKHQGNIYGKSQSAQFAEVKLQNVFIVDFGIEHMALLALPRFLDPTSHTRRATLNSIRHIFDSIPNRLPSVTSNSCNCVSDSSTCGSDYVAGCVYNSADTISKIC
jgi:hypothetical protein